MVRAASACPALTSWTIIGLAEITTKEGFFTNTIARLSGAKLKNGKLEFPFRISGTISIPVFSKGKGEKDVDQVRSNR